MTRKKDPKIIIAIIGAVGAVAGAAIGIIPASLKKEPIQTPATPVPVNAGQSIAHPNAVAIQVSGQAGNITIAPPGNAAKAPFSQPLPAGITNEKPSDDTVPFIVESVQTGVRKPYYCSPKTRLNALYETVVSDFALDRDLTLGTATRYDINWVFVEHSAQDAYEHLLSERKKAYARFVFFDSTNQLRVIERHEADRMELSQLSFPKDSRFHVYPAPFYNPPPMALPPGRRLKLKF